MRATTPKSPLKQGISDAAPFILVVSPFALVFGVVATESGLSIAEALLFSVAVIAGAAQFTTLQLLNENAPAVIALLSGLAVNLRMAMYSASLTPYLGAAPLWQRALIAYLTVDQSYACSVAAYERNAGWSLSQRVTYFFATCLPVIPFWYLMTLVGALIGESIPESAALDFAVPITFLALIAPMLRTPAHLAAALVASLSALALTWVPFNLGLIIAASLGMVVGAQAELILKKRGVMA
ncbi:AzlC family ABC transporter permease [uncultured Lentibacter sp.]|jgi:predicted branched-subunit amino acid permease|uniref:AzlC family ABC transporter permease n=1 Tax=uncultured Lentibacter sp. TaxID=1659309 RepID=UPI00261774DB|nr:AzlC family ABC transporter permease [uncultured Lentibacter sp.]